MQVMLCCTVYVFLLQKIQQNDGKLATFLFEIFFVFYDVEWSTDDFGVDIGDVEGDESERHEDDPDEDHIHEEDGGDIREIKLINSEFIDQDEEK